MTRRQISTSHTVVSCAVCGRTLLRGEHAEPFIAAGQRRLVCDLCAPRAVHEGWLREGFDDLGTVRRVSRSRSLLSRLRQRTGDFFEGDQRSDDTFEAPAEDPYLPPAERHIHAVPTNAELKVARAVEVFNGSEQARMVAGVAKSLGSPTVVSVRPSQTEGAVVSIVAAWEITWYRFEVDLGNEAAGVRQVEHGTELDELEPGDLEPSGAAFADGSLSLA